MVDTHRTTLEAERRGAAARIWMSRPARHHAFGGTPIATPRATDEAPEEGSAFSGKRAPARASADRDGERETTPCSRRS